MERFLSDQPSMAASAVVNYSSSSYGGFLFRSPNSPPPSPSLSPPPSIASLSHLFLGARFKHGSRSPVYRSSPAGVFQQPQPPLLPLPRLATLPARIPDASVRSRRNNERRKRKAFAGSGKETSPPSMKVKEERKLAIAAKEVLKYKSNPLPEEEEMESVYSLSPPPSSLPFPTFSLTRPKDGSNGGLTGGTLSGYCIA